MSAARSLDAAMKRIDEIRARQRQIIADGCDCPPCIEMRESWASEWGRWQFLPDCACEPDESCQECDAA